MKKGDKIGIVCCSNGISKQKRASIDQLCDILSQMGFIVVMSDYIYQTDHIFSANAKLRAQVLMNFYLDDDIKVIFDISGGDVANEILPYLDFEIIKEHPKLFFGYSDLTTIINALYQVSKQPSILYQVRNILHVKERQKELEDFLCHKNNDLLDFTYQFIQGKKLEGIVVGGNIRCLLKLAGTKYFPDMNKKILLLEAYGGGVGQMTTYLAQLKQLGVFEKISGIILGTFTKMESNMELPTMLELILPYAKELPIVKTKDIGHNLNAKAIVIGKELMLREQ